MIRQLARSGYQGGDAEIPVAPKFLARASGGWAPSLLRRAATGGAGGGPRLGAGGGGAGARPHSYLALSNAAARGVLRGHGRDPSAGGRGPHR